MSIDIRERERERERNMSQFSPVKTPLGDWTCNLGMCPGQLSHVGRAMIISNTMSPHLLGIHNKVYTDYIIWYVRFTLKYSSGEEEMTWNKTDKMLIILKLVLGFTEVHYTILFLYVFQNFYNVKFLKKERKKEWMNEWMNESIVLLSLRTSIT